MHKAISKSIIESHIDCLRTGKAIDPLEIANSLESLFNEREQLRKMDREAATYVESVIALRTDFSGEPPYTGWRGIGLSLNEALDERDRLREFRLKAIDLANRVLQATKEAETRRNKAGDWPEDNEDRVEPFAIALETDKGTALPRSKVRFSKLSHDPRAVISEEASPTIAALSTAELILG